MNLWPFLFSRSYLLACYNHALSAIPPNQDLMICIMCFVVRLISPLTCKKNDFLVLCIVRYDDLGMKCTPTPVHLKDMSLCNSGDLSGESMPLKERPCCGAPCSPLVVPCWQFLLQVPTALILRVMPEAETLSRVTTAELSKAANRDKSFLLQVDSIRNFVPVQQRGTVGNFTRELRRAVQHALPVSRDYKYKWQMRSI